MIITNYTFNAATKQITLTDYTKIEPDKIKWIINKTTGFSIYDTTKDITYSAYQKLGTSPQSQQAISVTNNVITFYKIDIEISSNTDDLLIEYDDPTVKVNIVGGSTSSSGSSTSELQTAGNLLLTDIKSNTGLQDAAAATSDTGTFSIISLIKRGLQNWTTLLSRIPALVSGSLPVTGPLTDTQIRATALPVETPMPTQLVIGQAKIATTNTAQALPSNTLKNGIVITSKDENLSNIWVGSSTVTTLDDGTGTGYRLTPGSSIGLATSNANAIFIIGGAGQQIYYAGN